MAGTFHATPDLLAALEDRSFDRPPAIVANAHVTGLAVARALAARDVPVIAVDRTGDGVASPSNAVTVAGEVTYPLDDRDGFRSDVEAIAARTAHEPVAFGCMDEWVHALAGTEPDGVRLPFADRAVVDAVLDKERLYATAERLDVPYPETYRLDLGEDGPAAECSGSHRGTGDAFDDRVDPETAAAALDFPLVVKPARKREFEELVGTNVIEVADREEYADVLAEARTAGVRVMAQGRVPAAVGEDCSLASYRSPDGDSLSVVGNPRVRYPREFGTSCVVDRVENPAVERRASAILDDAGYHGLSEAEFVYDERRETDVLLDINTRPWKWIGMPVAAGLNLPFAAYADAIGAADDSRAPREPRDARWIYLRDYLALQAEDDAFGDVLADPEWTSLLSGAFEDEHGLTTGVYRPSDPDPARRLLATEFSSREYYCAC